MKISNAKKYKYLTNSLSLITCNKFIAKKPINGWKLKRNWRKKIRRFRSCYNKKISSVKSCSSRFTCCKASQKNKINISKILRTKRITNSMKKWNASKQSCRILSQNTIISWNNPKISTKLNWNWPKPIKNLIKKSIRLWSKIKPIRANWCLPNKLVTSWGLNWNRMRKNFCFITTDLWNKSRTVQGWRMKSNKYQRLMMGWSHKWGKWKILWRSFNPQSKTG